MTRDEALRACIARGLRYPECAELVDDRMVDGAYCDGTIVMTVEGSRCVPAAVVAQKASAAPLPPDLFAGPTPPAPWGLPLALSFAFRALCALSDIANDR